MTSEAIKHQLIIITPQNKTKSQPLDDDDDDGGYDADSDAIFLWHKYVPLGKLTVFW